MVKALIAGTVLVAVLVFSWIMRKAFKGEYKEGHEDGETERAAAWRKMGKKVYREPTDDDKHFPARVRGHWLPSTHPDTPIRMEPTSTSNHAGRDKGNGAVHKGGGQK